MSAKRISHPALSHNELRVLHVVATGDTVDPGLRRLGSVMQMAFSDLTREALEVIDPDIVATAIFGTQVDCFDVARVLADSEYAGQLLLLAPRVPRPELVLSDVRTSFPSLDIELRLLPRDP